MPELQVRVRTDIAILNESLESLIALPDDRAALELDKRMDAWEQIDRLYEYSYSERGEICRQFEKRGLWKHLLNPNSKEPFNSFSAWMASGAVGGRRINFESLRDVRDLQDVPAEKLRGVPKSNVKILKQLSTAVRNQDAVLEAAKTLPQEQFLEKVEKDHPDQHIEGRRALRFSPGRSGARKVEEWIRYAIEHDLAGNRDEALVMACEEALANALLDERLEAEMKEGQPA